MTNEERIEAVGNLEIMFTQLEERHDNTAYVGTNDFVGMDANLDNVKAAINDVKAAIQAYEQTLPSVEEIRNTMLSEIRRYYFNGMPIEEVDFGVVAQQIHKLITRSK